MGLKIALLISAYNEENNMRRLIQDISFPREDIIVVDDGSTDNTWEIARDMGAVVLRHKENLGKGSAHRTGFKYALDHEYDYVITLDGDGQHDPQEIPRFVTAAKRTGADIIIGLRNRSLREMPLLRWFTNFMTSFVVSFVSHERVKDAQSGYRAISARVMRHVHLTTSHFDTESEILIKAARSGCSIGEVPISTIYRGGESRIRPCIDTIRFIILGFRSVWR
jgi:glycosyltransferase involved in cell wall biosynthesis